MLQVCVTRLSCTFSLFLPSKKGWEYSVAVFLVINFIAFLVILICYLFMYRTVRSARRLTRVMARHYREINVGRKMALVVLTNFICWFPIIIMGIIAMNGYALPAAVYSWTAVFVLPFNSALNPIVYTLAHYKTTTLFSSSQKRDSITGKALSIRQLSMTGKGRNGTNGDIKSLKPPPGYVSLYEYLRDENPLDPMDLLQISCFLAEQLKDIHATGYVLGGITVHNVFVSSVVDSQYLRVYVPDHNAYRVAPSRDCNDYAEDMEEYGKVIQTMLRTYNAQLNRLLSDQQNRNNNNSSLTNCD